MPLYEYRCNPCGEFEAWRSMTKYNAPINCPECNQVATKIFSAPNINLNSGSLSAITRLRDRVPYGSQFDEPRLVKQEPREPTKPRYQTSASNRPWMVSHTPPRF
ncbi:MAG TPA: zinc ribbon domain-containing protein [Coleofasciculaceae cyanobacterium]|jgi:putative FmdB family regulatory protein